MSLLLTLIAVVIVFAVCRSALGRKLMYFPSHRPADGILTQWNSGSEIIGYARKVESPKNVWLMLHGNAGQAIDREYALPCFSPGDSVYILEYPGYGMRAGSPSMASINRAAREAYLQLRETYPRLPVCVVGESIGSGPAATLARLDSPPDKLVLITPFDRLSRVGAAHYPRLLVWLMLADDWNNEAALAHYQGAVEIYGAKDDDIIPVARALALAGAVPAAKFVLIEGGHNEWSHQGRVKIRNP